MMLMSERARRYLMWQRELYRNERLDGVLETAFCERAPSDGVVYPMDKVLDGLMEMRRAGLWKNETATGPGNVVDTSAMWMMDLVGFARSVDRISPKGAYDGLICMDGARTQEGRDDRGHDRGVLVSDRRGGRGAGGCREIGETGCDHRGARGRHVRALGALRLRCGAGGLTEIRDGDGAQMRPETDVSVSEGVL